MKIVPYSQIHPDDWDRLAADSLQGWIFHWRAWVDLETNYGRLENHSFGVKAGDRLLVVMPLFCSRLNLGPFIETLVHSGLHRHAGMAIDPGLTGSDVAAARRIAMKEVQRVAVFCDADRIHLASQNLSPENLSPARREIPYWVIDYGFELGGSFGPAGLSPAPGLATTVVDQIVDLTANEDELFARLKDGCRRAVRKALTAGLEVVSMEHSPNAGWLDEYWRLAQLSAARTGEQLPVRGYYATMHDGLGPKGALEVLFVKSREKFVAAAILLHDKRATQFFSGVSDPTHFADRVNDMLHWSAILRAKRRGNHSYRLGPYFPTIPQGWPIETVSRFKSKFGARAWTVVQGSRYLKPERYVALAQSHVARLCSDLARCTGN